MNTQLFRNLRPDGYRFILAIRQETRHCKNCDCNRKHVIVEWNIPKRPLRTCLTCGDMYCGDTFLPIHFTDPEDIKEVRRFSIERAKHHWKEQKDSKPRRWKRYTL